MKSYSNQNEGYRILEEFVCQAIPDPSLTRKEPDLEVKVADTRPLLAALAGEDGRLKERIEIGNGVALYPLFTSLRHSGADTGNEILTFMLNIPVGIALNSVAAALYDWMTKQGVRWARANGVEVPVAGTVPEGVKVIAEALSRKAAAGESDEQR